MNDYERYYDILLDLFRKRVGSVEDIARTYADISKALDDVLRVMASGFESDLFSTALEDKENN